MRIYHLLFLCFALLASACTQSYPEAPLRLSHGQALHRFHAGDAVKITIFEEPSLSDSYIVNPQGDIILPLTGRLHLADLSESEATEKLKEQLESGYMKEAQVSVTLDHQAVFVYILGEVQKPGNYPFLPGMTAIQAIAQAGGYTYRADDNDIILRRHSTKDASYNKYQANEDTPLLAGDTLTIEERYF